MPTIKSIISVKGYDLIVLSPSASVLDAVELMAEVNVGTVIVANAGDVLGIFTERDLLRRVVSRGINPASLVLGDVMSSPLRSCGLGEDLSHCAQILTKSHMRHLAVVEEGVLCGLISLRDILHAQFRSSQEYCTVLQKLVVREDPGVQDTSGNVEAQAVGSEDRTRSL